MSILTDRLRELYSVIAHTQPEPHTLPFAAWQPDLPVLGNPGATVARNVIPRRHSYGPVGAVTPATDALDARALSATRARDSTGNYFNYASDASKLYEVRASGVTDKSKAGGYSTASDDVPEFALFRDKVIWSNYTDPVQVLTAGAAGMFADLFTSTEKPKFKHVTTVGQFLVGGNVNSNSDGIKPNRVAWSAFGDITDMDPDAQTQSDYEDLSEGGAVQKVIGGLQYGLIFQQSAVRRMTYPAGDAIFDLRGIIDRERGCAVPGSVVGHGRLAFYLSEEGFHMTDGTQSYDVGENQVNRTFWKQFDQGNAHLVSSAIDPLNKLYAITFPGTGGTRKVWFLYWPDRKWSEAEPGSIEILANTTSEALTLEDLDALYPTLEDMDAAGVTLDSAQFKGGGLLFGAFDANHKLAYFDGANLAATLETGEAEIFPGRYARVSKLRPLIDGGTLTAAVAGRNRQIDAAAYGTAGTLDGIGEVGVLNEARYHRFRCNIAAGGNWTHAQGLQIQAAPMGMQGFG